MALDNTAKLANFRDSARKFFVDNLKRASNIPLTFDKGLSKPDIKNRNVARWVAINWGATYFGIMSEAMVDVICCTRKDNEGFKLAQLHDLVMSYLTDSSGTDGARRITFYRSHRTEDWVNIGGIVIQNIIPSAQLEAPDETKFITLSCIMRFASKI